MQADLRYRRPVPTGVEVGIHAEVVRVSDRDYLAVAEIVDDSGDVLTSATAKWRRLA